MFEGHTVTNLRRVTSVDELHAAHREVFLILMRWTDGALHDVPSLQTVLLDLLRRDIHIVGRREIVVVRAAKEAVAIGETLQHAVGGDDFLEVEFRYTNLSHIIDGLSLLRL